MKFISLIFLQVCQTLTRSFSTGRPAAATQMNVRDALNSALDEEMEHDDKVRTTVF